MNNEDNTLKNEIHDNISDERKKECETELINPHTQPQQKPITPPVNTEPDLVEVNPEPEDEKQPVDENENQPELNTTTETTPEIDTNIEVTPPKKTMRDRMGSMFSFGKSANKKEDDKVTKDDKVKETPPKPEPTKPSTDVVNAIPSQPTKPIVNIYKPNNLIILINTKIRNHRLLRYRPNMTIPGESSNVVYFDPLVKLFKPVVDKIPQGQPENEKFTQFFNRTDFNSLLLRTLSKYQQPIYTFAEAMKFDVTDNNIQVTLETLFAQGNPFYINGERYTVNSYDWIHGDWEVDTRPHYDQRVRFLPYGVAYPRNYIPNFSAQARMERKTIPPVALKGDGLQSTSKIKRAVNSVTSPLVREPLDASADIRNYRPRDIVNLLDVKKEHPEDLKITPPGEKPPVPVPDTPPVVGPEIKPTTDPVPEPIPKSIPSPTPVPEPIPTPGSNPDPKPTIATDPTNPEPTPVPVPKPVPEPEPEPEPVPEPEPEPVPEPEPEPSPKPDPNPTSVVIPDGDDVNQPEDDNITFDEPEPTPGTNVVGETSDDENITKPDDGDIIKPELIRQVTDDTPETDDEIKEIENEQKHLDEKEKDELMSLVTRSPHDMQYTIAKFLSKEDYTDKSDKKESQECQNIQTPKNYNDKLSQSFAKLLIQESIRGFFKPRQLTRIFKMKPTENKDEPIKIQGLHGNVCNNLNQWKIITNPGDGDCLFEGIAQILNNTKREFIKPRELKNGKLEIITGENPYVTANGTYNVSRLRKALSKYLITEYKMLQQGQVQNSALNDFIEAVPTNLPELAANEKKNPESVSSSDREFLTHFKFMLSRDNKQIMTPEKIAEVISIPQNKANLPPKERGKNRMTKDKYYWGDEMALRIFELLFNIKFTLLTIQKPERIMNNQRVKIKEKGNTIMGNVMKIENTKPEKYHIVNDLYQIFVRTKDEIESIQSLSVYHSGSTLVPDKNTMVAFMLYSQNGVNGHFEAIMRKSSREASKVADNAIFKPDVLPSYISYLIFTQICGFDRHGEFSYVNAESPYLLMKGIKTEITRMYNIYTELLRDKGYTEQPKPDVQQPVEPMYLQLGGEVKRYITNYLHNANTQSKNAYYIVIDLDLFPGDSISRMDRFRLNCADSYDKMSEAWADIWGFRYQPGELDTARFKKDVPTAQGIPVASVEPVQSLKKRPSAPPETRKMQGGKKNKISIRKKKNHYKTHKYSYSS